MEFIKDLWTFFLERKKWWLIPLVIVLLLIAFLLIFAEGTAVGSFIYTLF
jgi:membrane protein YdbS with pleckstrin-like domain